MHKESQPKEQDVPKRWGISSDGARKVWHRKPKWNWKLIKIIENMKTHIPQQIIVPVYYFIDEDENVNFDIEQMREFFENELQKVVFN